MRKKGRIKNMKIERKMRILVAQLAVLLLKLVTCACVFSASLPRSDCLCLCLTGASLVEGLSVSTTREKQRGLSNKIHNAPIPYPATNNNTTIQLSTDSETLPMSSTYILSFIPSSCRRLLLHPPCAPRLSQIPP